MTAPSPNEFASPDLLTLDFDQYQRYRLCAELIVQLAGETSKPLSILEVGSNVLNLLPRFLPERLGQVIRCDTHAATQADSDYVQIDPDTNLPFDADSFDFVVSMDVLEHVEPKSRPRFLADVHRIARTAALVAFPRGDDDVRECESTMNEIYRTARGSDHPFLAEHGEFGLPDRATVESCIRDLDADFRVFHNSPLKAWLGNCTLSNLMALQDGQSIILEMFNSEYNSNYFGAFADSPGYRLFYVIGSAETLADIEQPELPKPYAAGDAAPACWVGFAQILQWFLGRLRASDHSFMVETARLQAAVRAISEQKDRIELDAMSDRQARAREREAALAALEEATRRADHAEQLLRDSRALKVARAFGTPVQKARRIAGSAASIAARRAARRFPGLAQWTAKRMPGLVRRLAPEPAPISIDQYGQWWNDHRPRATQIAAMRRTASGWGNAPLISLITPVYNVDERWLRACVDSVLNQAYSNWELCLADDASTAPHVWPLLEEFARHDSRIRVTRLRANGGISAASNAALELATGDYIALLDNDDELAPNALFEVAQAIIDAPDLDYIYTDEDKIDESGNHSDPLFKPDWSPEHFLSTHYPCHLSVLRTSIVRDIGGFRPEFDGSQDYDICLRATERARRIHHIPRVLYHWRMIQGSTAESQQAKPEAHDAARRALSEALVRRDLGGRVEETGLTGIWRARPEIARRPLVSIVIPTAGRTGQVRGETIDLLLHCVTSIERLSTWSEIEFVIVHNGDLSSAQLDALSELESPTKLVEFERPFNLSEKINLGVERADGEFCILLNDDIEVISPSWIEAMFEWAQQADIGAVGSTLLYPDGRIQHAGVVLLEGVPHHSYLGFGIQSIGHGGVLHCVRNAIAVTGACVMIRRSLFREVGGFDPDLPLNYNDVDLCLKLQSRGKRSVVTPHAQLYHFEGVSKTHHGLDIELSRFLARHPAFASGRVRDPYYNPNFDQELPYFELPGTREIGSKPLPPPSRGAAGSPADCYETWIQHRVFDRREHYSSTLQAGLLSLITPAYNTAPEFLEKLARSVLGQTWHTFEWVIADNGSTDPGTISALDRIAQDPRVKLVRLATNQDIVGGMRAAFEGATGRYVLPLDSDDKLYPDALAVMASALERAGYPAIAYSDEDKIGEDDVPHAPFFKPDWDPVLFLNCCYIAHLCAIDRETAHRLGIYTEAKASGCTDLDTFLRFAEAGHRPVHIPEVLYSWRIHSGSTAAYQPDVKPYTVVHQEHVLGRHLRWHPRGAEFEIVPNDLLHPPTTWRVRRKDRTPPATRALILGSKRPELEAATGVWQAAGASRARAVLDRQSLAREVREAADSGEWVLLADSETGAASADWVVEASTLLEFHESVVGVTGKVVDQTGRIRGGAGVIGFGGTFGYPDHGFANTDPGYYGLLQQQRRVGVVSLRASLFDPEFLASVVAKLPDGQIDVHQLEWLIASHARETEVLLASTPFCTVESRRSSPALVVIDPQEPAAEAVHADHDPAYPRFHGQDPKTAFSLVWSTASP